MTAICGRCHQPEDEGNHAKCWREIYGRLLQVISDQRAEIDTLRERLIDAGILIRPR